MQNEESFVYTLSFYKEGDNLNYTWNFDNFRPKPSLSSFSLPAYLKPANLHDALVQKCIFSSP